jgi:hypothetical protein
MPRTTLAPTALVNQWRGERFTSEKIPALHCTGHRLSLVGREIRPLPPSFGAVRANNAGEIQEKQKARKKSEK